jgi:V/A-type H+-transporting ATPase subunit B
MPSDDITHPIPDLTGYITEGQIVLDRELDRADIYPPVKVLPCLSRLMKDGTGEGFTHADHPDLANQLYAAYARAVHVRVLASVVGREGLTSADRLFLDFGDLFEKEFIHQDSSRSLEQGMETGWHLLRMLPVSELIRLNDRQINQYIKDDVVAQ